MESTVVAAEKSDKRDEQMSTFLKYRRIFNVEPVMLMAFLAGNVMAATSGFLIVFERCYEIYANSGVGNTVDFCGYGIYKANVSYELDLEKDVAYWQVFATIATALPAVLVMPLISSLSDVKLGRKKLLLLGLLGLLFDMTMNLCLISVYKYLPNVLHVSIVQNGLASLTGDASTMVTMALAMITDDARRSDKDDWTNNIALRFGIFNALPQLAGLLGSGTTSLMQNLLHIPLCYFVLSYIAFALAIATLMMTIFVNETHFPVDQGTERREQHTCRSVAADVVGKYKGFVHVLTKKRIGYDRLFLCTTIAFNILSKADRYDNLIYLLTKLPPFSFSDRQITGLELSSRLFTIAGIISVPLLVSKTRFKKQRETVIILLSLIMNILCYAWLSLATEAWEIFTANLLDSFIVSSYQPAIGAFLFRFITEDEVGRAYGLVTLMVRIVPIMKVALFNALYRSTVAWWPGFTYAVLAFVAVFVLFGQIIIHSMYWKQQRKQDEERKRLLVE